MADMVNGGVIVVVSAFVAILLVVAVQEGGLPSRGEVENGAAAEQGPQGTGAVRPPDTAPRPFTSWWATIDGLDSRGPLGALLGIGHDGGDKDGDEDHDASGDRDLGKSEGGDDEKEGDAEADGDARSDDGDDDDGTGDGDDHDDGDGDYDSPAGDDDRDDRHDNEDDD